MTRQNSVSDILIAARDDEAYRKFKSWGVSTAKLLADLERIENEREAQQQANLTNTQRLAKGMLEIIAPFAKVDPGTHDYRNFLRELQDVLERAIAMDRDVCLQASTISWRFSTEVSGRFDNTTMVVEKGEMPPSADSTVAVVIAPAMYKKGRSNGDHLGNPPRLILPMEVTCRPVGDVQ